MHRLQLWTDAQNLTAARHDELQPAGIVERVRGIPASPALSVTRHLHTQMLGRIKVRLLESFDNDVNGVGLVIRLLAADFIGACLTHRHTSQQSAGVSVEPDFELFEMDLRK